MSYATQKVNKRMDLTPAEQIEQAARRETDARQAYQQNPTEANEQRLQEAKDEHDRVRRQIAGM